MSLRLLGLSALVAFAPHLAQAEFHAGDHAPETVEFLRIAEGLKGREGSVDQEYLKPYRLLLVPGLVTDVTEEVGKFTEKLRLTPTPGFLSSFFQQREWMAASHIDFEIAPINRAGTCDENGDAIARAIAESPRPVILVTQSKGGVDTLHGLIRHPEVRAKVAGWVAYQPPHDGSILADMIQDHHALRGPTAAFLSLLRGTGLAIADMSTSSRRAYNEAHRFEIIGLTRTFPIVTLLTTETGASASRYLFGPRASSAFLAPFIPVIAERDRALSYSGLAGLNDGIASVHGTCLERSACVYLTGIDHFDSVMNTAPFKSLASADRVSLFRAMVQMLVHRIVNQHHLHGL